MRKERARKRGTLWTKACQQALIEGREVWFLTLESGRTRVRVLATTDTLVEAIAGVYFKEKIFRPSQRLRRDYLSSLWQTE